MPADAAAPLRPAPCVAETGAVVYPLLKTTVRDHLCIAPTLVACREQVAGSGLAEMQDRTNKKLRHRAT
ncbi:MAG: hypothetical protein CMH11_12555 [Maritimibacter sp.]|nr:hypothetical protein [Maritimibacter sp.]|tara:strand:+ start:10104 stop:10310 length:207 start_codon:yes stop_codon:yes gene_type:complete